MERPAEEDGRRPRTAGRVAGRTGQTRTRSSADGTAPIVGPGTFPGPKPVFLGGVEG